MQRRSSCIITNYSKKECNHYVTFYGYDTETKEYLQNITLDSRLKWHDTVRMRKRCRGWWCRNAFTHHGVNLEVQMTLQLSDFPSAEGVNASAAFWPAEVPSLSFKLLPLLSLRESRAESQCRRFGPTAGDGRVRLSSVKTERVGMKMRGGFSGNTGQWRWLVLNQWDAALGLWSVEEISRS